MAKTQGTATRVESTQPSGALDLRNSRQRKGISLEQIAEQTKISIRFLRAIEAEDFHELPGGIFATSYMKQYAAAIGIDDTLLLSHYRASNEPAADVRELRIATTSATKPLLLRFWSAAAGR